MAFANAEGGVLVVGASKGQAMQVVRDGHRVSTGDVQSALGVSRPAAIDVLRALEVEGLIEWIGKSPRDPRAYWQLHIE